MIEGDNEMPDKNELREALPIDVVTLCQLCARIFYRCVQEREAQTLRRLFGSSCTSIEQHEVASHQPSARKN